MEKVRNTQKYQEKTQLEFVRDYLTQGRCLTPVKAMAEFGIMRLAHYVWLLRGEGYDIRLRWKKSFQGTRYGEYYLMPKDLLGRRVRIIGPEKDEVVFTDFPYSPGIDPIWMKEMQDYIRLEGTVSVQHGEGEWGISLPGAPGLGSYSFKTSWLELV